MLQPYRCPNCMNINSSGLEVCPHCGHEWGTPAAQTHHIAPGSTLAGQYMIGIVLQENADSTAYLAYDEKSGQAVILREYFPIKLAVRGVEGVTPATSAAGEFRTGLRSFLSDTKALVRNGSALGVFEHGGTAYFVSPVPGKSAPPAVPSSAATHSTPQTAKKPVPFQKKNGLARPVKVILGVVAAILILLGILFIVGSLSNLGEGRSQDGVTKVPDVCGMSLEEAASTLEKCSLTLMIVDTEYSESPRDSVLSQEPAADNELYEGSVLRVILSAGEAPKPAENGKVTVGDVIYKPLEEAQNLLEGQGLIVVIIEAESDKVQKGNVISQDPAPDTEVEEGVTVTLTISLGSKKQEEGTSKPKPNPTTKPAATPTIAPTPVATATPVSITAPGIPSGNANNSGGNASPATPGNTAKPTTAPTVEPTVNPTEAPVATPSSTQTTTPTNDPTPAPEATPSPAQTAQPTDTPEVTPSNEPVAPSMEPSAAPSSAPSEEPVITPSAKLESDADTAE